MITRIKGNVKGQIDAALGPRTLLLGPNGSGKSAVVAALELALTGRASDLAGKTDRARSADLMTLAPPGADTLWAEAHGPDGTVWKFELTRGGKPQQTQTTRGEAQEPPSLPLRDMRGALSSPDHARRWFLDQIGGAFSAADVTEQIPPHLRNAYGAVSVSGQGAIDALFYAREVAKKRSLDASAAARGAEAAIAASAGLVPPTADELAAAEAAVAHGVSPEVRAIRAELESEIDEGRWDRAQAVRLVLDTMVERRVSSCGICAQPVTVELLAARQEAIQAALTRLDAQFGHRAELEAKLREARVAGDQQRASAVQVLGRLHQAKGQWEAIQRAKAQVSGAKEEATRWKELTQACDDAVAALLAQGRERFTARVQEYLPSADTFGLTLDPFAFGLVRDGCLHSALSGAEWARITIAMACALTPDAQGASVIIPEDRAWDGTTLAAVMRALAHAPGQIILCSTVLPKGKRPRGWTVVTLGAGHDTVEPQPQPASPAPEPADNGADELIL